MQETSWDKLVDAVDIKFGIDNSGKSTEPLEDNADLEQKISFIEFAKNGRHFRLTRTIRPAVLERKSIYHRAAGSNVTYQNVYDPNETTSVIQLYRNDGGEWEPVDTEELAA